MSSNAGDDAAAAAATTAEDDPRNKRFSFNLRGSGGGGDGGGGGGSGNFIFDLIRVSFIAPSSFLFYCSILLLLFFSDRENITFDARTFLQT